MHIICKKQCTIPGGASGLNGNGWALFSSVLAVFMPKCALCWAAYIGIFSSAGLVIRYQPWFLPVSLVFFLCTLVKLLLNAIQHKNFISFSLALLAGLLIISQRKITGSNGIRMLAIVLMTAAVMMSNIIILYKQLVMVMKGRRKQKESPGLVKLAKVQTYL